MLDALGVLGPGDVAVAVDVNLLEKVLEQVVPGRRELHRDGLAVRGRGRLKSEQRLDLSARLGRRAASAAFVSSDKVPVGADFVTESTETPAPMVMPTSDARSVR